MESIPGGTSCIFLANNIIKITTSTKLEESEKYGIKGFMTILEYLKSRSNESGRKFEMVFSQSDGFDNLLTNLNLLNENKMLKGSPRAYYIDGCEDIKFTWKNFKEKYYENEELRKAFDHLVKDLMIDYIPKASDLINNDEEDSEEESYDEDVELIECIDEDLNIWKGSDGLYYDGETGAEVDPKKIKIKKKVSKK